MWGISGLVQSPWKLTDGTSSATSNVVKRKIGTQSILSNAAPLDPAETSRHRRVILVQLSVPELVKRKIAGSRALGVSSDFVIDDVTGKTLGRVVGVTQ